ncbi:MAG: hypothetical protein ACFHVJ_11595 [Aestuariibacter sp.]
MIELTTKEWISLASHIKKWITNLKRAKTQRKNQSKKALRDVIKASQQTTIYLRMIRETGDKSLDREAELAMLWTDLSFELEDINLLALAQKCRLKGKYWADPEKITSQSTANNQLQIVSSKLDDVEKNASALLKELLTKA